LDTYEIGNFISNKTHIALGKVIRISPGSVTLRDQDGNTLTRNLIAKSVVFTFAFPYVIFNKHNSLNPDDWNILGFMNEEPDDLRIFDPSGIGISALKIVKKENVV